MEGKFVVLLAIILVSATAASMYFVLPVINNGQNQINPIEAKLLTIIQHSGDYVDKLVSTKAMALNASTYLRWNVDRNTPASVTCYFMQNGQWQPTDKKALVLFPEEYITGDSWDEDSELALLLLDEYPQWYGSYDLYNITLEGVVIGSRDVKLANHEETFLVIDGTETRFVNGWEYDPWSGIEEQTDQMEISIDSVSNSSSTAFTVVVRNTGDITARVDKIYVGTSTSNLVAATGVTAADIAVSSTGSFSATYSTGFAKGTTYIIKAVCTDGQSATKTFSP